MTDFHNPVSDVTVSLCFSQIFDRDTRSHESYDPRFLEMDAGCLVGQCFDNVMFSSRITQGWIENVGLENMHLIRRYFCNTCMSYELAS